MKLGHTGPADFDAERKQFIELLAKCTDDLLVDGAPMLANVVMSYARQTSDMIAEVAGDPSTHKVMIPYMLAGLEALVTECQMVARLLSSSLVFDAEDGTTARFRFNFN